MSHWLRDAGLVPKTVRDLAPKTSEAADKLTVTLWLAERRDTVRPAISKPARGAEKLEEAR